MCWVLTVTTEPPAPCPSRLSAGTMINKIPGMFYLIPRLCRYQLFPINFLKVICSRQIIQIPRSHHVSRWTSNLTCSLRPLKFLSHAYRFSFKCPAKVLGVFIVIVLCCCKNDWRKLSLINTFIQVYLINHSEEWTHIATTWLGIYITDICYMPGME